MSLAIYGGSFNPPHNGHISAVETVLRELAPDHFLIIPDCLAPHKVMPAGTPSPGERLELCRLAFGGFGNVTVSDMELQRGGTSYTSDTIAAIRADFDGEIFLVIGSDMLLSFSTWHEFEYILKNCTLAVLSREENDLEELRSAAESLEELYGASVTILPHSPVVVSSTQVRKALRRGRAGSLVPASVIDYIESHNLYI